MLLYLIVGLRITRPLSHQDIFIAQPTSIGSGIRNDFVGKIINRALFALNLDALTYRNSDSTAQLYAGP